MPNKKEDEEKTQIQVSVSTANKLRKLMEVGDTYDSVINKALAYLEEDKRGWNRGEQR
jgi:hypothetical protein